ncbi:IS110 family transposase [Streptomyces chiangmaiensis]|uniref:Transposase n=1 Tax=Streptomyces chiangmaiensis TaxID=766497 RepID=A0ABU7FPU7_9ACTN|nr:transposase [Streptomyces chiangmaiensis]MED7825878.1 transposase [Streptomyces chiangmaiensis]
MITIGIDPHKSSHTAVAVEAAGHQLAQRRFVVNAGTVRQLIRWCAQWPERRFAVEGAKGLGRSLAQQLAAAGEQVVDVPSTLSARVRLLATGKDRKTDAADALHVAQVALQSGVSMLRSPGCPASRASGPTALPAAYPGDDRTVAVGNCTVRQRSERSGEGLLGRGRERGGWG